uniref:Guanylate cyclase activator 2B n=1 Tax=Lates calcarifer TaxID=8187 RepID=A0A4W6DIW4_LATCA
MRSLCIVLVLCVCSGALGVQVKVGDRSFPLEAVKQLKELMDLNDNVSPHLAETSVTAVCANPLLPQVFRTVCQGKGTGIVFSRLGVTGAGVKKQICKCYWISDLFRHGAIMVFYCSVLLSSCLLICFLIYI